MVSLYACQQVFKGKGFLSNDNGGSPYRRISHISAENPIHLLKRLCEFDYYYDRCKFDTLLNAKVDMFEDKYVVISEWTGKVIPSAEDLYQFIKEQSWVWHYVEYAK
jgi:hypothetical protein